MTREQALEIALGCLDARAHVDLDRETAEAASVLFRMLDSIRRNRPEERRARRLEHQRFAEKRMQELQAQIDAEGGR
jgi:hypothetical protein